MSMSVTDSRAQSQARPRSSLQELDVAAALRRRNAADAHLTEENPKFKVKVNLTTSTPAASSPDLFCFFHDMLGMNERKLLGLAIFTAAVLPLSGRHCNTTADSRFCDFMTIGDALLAEGNGTEVTAFVTAGPDTSVDS